MQKTTDTSCAASPAQPLPVAAEATRPPMMDAQLNRAVAHIQSLVNSAKRAAQHLFDFAPDAEDMVHLSMAIDRIATFATALAASPARRPLTDAQCGDLIAGLNRLTTGFKCWGWIDVVRATEKFHGILAAGSTPRAESGQVDELTDLHRHLVDEIADLHPATRDLVRRFAHALADKLAAAERKYGYSDGWADPDWLDECRQHLIEHVAKGDPRDVAAYCAFLWHHGATTADGEFDGTSAAANVEPTIAECINYLDIWNSKLEAAIDRQALEQLGQHANDEPFVVGRDPMEQLP